MESLRSSKEDFERHKKRLAVVRENKEKRNIQLQGIHEHFKRYLNHFTI